MAKRRNGKRVETLTYDKARRRNIPTAEYEPVLRPDDRHPVHVAYERRNPDLDPQLVWRGKDLADLVVPAPARCRAAAKRARVSMGLDREARRA